MFLFCVFSWLVEKYKSVTSMLMRFLSEFSRKFFGLIIGILKNGYSIIGVIGNDSGRLQYYGF